MDPKPYQRAVLADLLAFLSQLSDDTTISQAFRRHWHAKGAVGMPPYKDNLPETPNICLKVPTGGGKTFLAACALEPIFAWANPKAGSRPRVVVWLVPSLTILRQTLRDLRDPGHPLHRTIARDFGNRFAVLDKDDALHGAGFTLDAIRTQLTILVLSYASLKDRTNDRRKLHTANGYLMDFRALPGLDMAENEAPSVVDALRATAPVVIVDESHNAANPLSHKMLTDLNPSFVLDLTATPRDNANIVSYADAMALKAAGMVKLPVILRNRQDLSTVYGDAIDLQATLEREAIRAEQEEGQRYIRPIVLFLAERNTGNDDQETFSKVRASLLAQQVPAEQIAIKTGDVDEIGNSDLLSRDCPIRFIITVNALKEGWDCSFAYILASLADRASEIDVTQVLGRVLRQPGGQPHSSSQLNRSYVLTASEKFRRTISAIINGLKESGFSENDYRVPDSEDDGAQETSPPANQSSRRAETSLADWMDNASRQGQSYDRMVEQIISTGGEAREVEAAMNRKHMRVELREKASTLVLPQFFLKTPAIGFLPGAGREHLLDRTNLLEKFSLVTADAHVGFGALNDDTMELDIEATRDGSRPRIRVIDMQREKEMANLLRSHSRETQIRELTGWVFKLMSRMPPLADPDIRAYVRRVLEAQPAEGLEACIANPRQSAKRIQAKIASLGTEYASREFERLVASRDIFPQPSYCLPASIAPAKIARPFAGRLYEDEAEINGFEEQVVGAISSLDNVLFWHRNLSRGHGFRINGAINHYPDFIITLKSGITVILETKGDDRDNTDSKVKLSLGQQWANLSGRNFSYFMVFDQTEMTGALRLNDFIETLRGM